MAWPATVSKDLDGNELILDADGDTSITASTDDRIDFRLLASDVVVWNGASGGALVFNEQSADLDFRVEGANTTNGFLLDAGQDAISLGGANVDGAAFTLNNLQQRTHVTSVGSQSHIPAQTTDFDNASGTIAIGSAWFVGIPTWTNANATLTMTEATTVYIQGAPVGSTNVTVSTGYALWVDAGTVRIDDTVELGHATDTTLARASAGDVNIEGNIIYRASGTDVVVADGGAGRSTATAYAVLCGGTTSTAAHQSIAGLGSSGEVLTSNGAAALPTFQAGTSDFPSGTSMLFQQTAAPTNWTKQTTHNNKAMRLQTGTVTTGGATAFTSVFGSGKTTGAHTLTTSQLAPHTHSGGGGSASLGSNASSQTTATPGGTGGAGGGSSHTHTLSLNLRFVDFIIANKD